MGAGKSGVKKADLVGRLDITGSVDYWILYLS